ncbi:MAG TPA: hypothetical protein VIA18_27795 [Polyangia bacterium]|jgi:hypothetical protein|nr:hypothetical protein [Polyangia bacterium]
MSKKRRSAAAVLAPPPEVAPAIDVAEVAADGSVAHAGATTEAASETTARAVVDGPRRLATALAHLARRVWPALAPAERATATAAVDAFVAAPTPASFVAAARTLVRVRQARQTGALQEVWGERAFARAAAQLADLGFLDDALVAAVTAQPRDAAAGRRLSTLASLLLAHAELAARLRTTEPSLSAALRADRRNTG